MLEVSATAKPTTTLKLGKKTRTVELDHTVGSNPEASQVPPAREESPAPKPATRAPAPSGIVKGVPMPEARGGGGKAKYPWEAMQPGDAFFVEGAKVETFYTLTASARKKYGKLFRAARVDDGEAFGFSGVSGVGVWCLEAE